jgi:hypothetical protein
VELHSVDLSRKHMAEDTSVVATDTHTNLEDDIAERWVVQHSQKVFRQARACFLLGEGRCGCCSRGDALERDLAGLETTREFAASIAVPCCSWCRLI